MLDLSFLPSRWEVRNCFQDVAGMKRDILEILAENAELLAEQPLNWEIEIQRGEAEMKMLRDRIVEVEAGSEGGSIDV